MQGTSTVIGPALRQVRDKRGLTLDEAARDTRIRREFLEAIEEEDFDRLLGDVHVRGCLRTYASYLRLSPDKVVEAYSASRPEADLTTPLPMPGPSSELSRPRRRDDHRLLVMVAAVLLILAVAFGVLSARRSAPAPADLTDETPDFALVAPGPISVAVVARSEVDVTIAVDEAARRTYHLAAGEGRAFEADRTLMIRLSDGGAAEVTVSGKELGFPGRSGRPWRETFSYDSPTPSPTG